MLLILSAELAIGNGLPERSNHINRCAGTLVNASTPVLEALNVETSNGICASTGIASPVARNRLASNGNAIRPPSVPPPRNSTYPGGV
jgi:hypothetical protein